MMEAIARFARMGNRVLSFIATILILVMLLYGGYSLWDTTMLYQGAFTDSEMMKLKPIDENGGGKATFSELLKINPDVCAWIAVDDTHIDYPVVQGNDDMEYVNKDVYGEFSLSGTIFLSCKNTSDFSDSYNLLYGHHMANGGMFGDVVDFVKEDIFEKHTKGKLYLPEKTYEIELFACMETDAYDLNVFYPSDKKESHYTDLLNYIEDVSVQYRDIGVSVADQIIALSTCADASTNGRVIVFGRLNIQP